MAPSDRGFDHEASGQAGIARNGTWAYAPDPEAAHVRKAVRFIEHRRLAVAPGACRSHRMLQGRHPFFAIERLLSEDLFARRDAVIAVAVIPRRC
jgi:hypothetical protein